jgi:hypothetical protein
MDGLDFCAAFRRFWTDFFQAWSEVDECTGADVMGIRKAVVDASDRSVSAIMDEYCFIGTIV